MQFVLTFLAVFRENVPSFLAPSQSNQFVEEVINNGTVAPPGPMALSWSAQQKCFVGGIWIL